MPRRHTVNFVLALGMVFRSSFLRPLLVVLFCVLAVSVKAQPMLPDLAGITQKGINILTWTCQYDGVKSIAVQRSSDSSYNFKTVGFVKNIKKGVQIFADGHPMPGNNWYQLEIVFGSDVDWISNKIRFHVDSATLENQQIILPPNDSLQQYVVTPGKPAPTNKKSKIVISLDTNAHITTNSKNVAVSNSSPADPGTTAAEKTISKITISLGGNAGDLTEPTYLKSEHVYTDPLTGHVTIKVPDIGLFRYSVKFFDQKNVTVIDVPRISKSPVILDKRNFEKKGLYKFILRRDSHDYETGYITIY